MSTSLYWEPVIPVKGKSLDNQLKFIFGPTYWNHDGALVGEEVHLNTSEIPYLCGVRDATPHPEVKRDIDTLIDAIKKYGSVKIWLD